MAGYGRSARSAHDSEGYDMELSRDADSDGEKGDDMATQQEAPMLQRLARLERPKRAGPALRQRKTVSDVAQRGERGSGVIGGLGAMQGRLPIRDRLRT